ncbi:hypothetical protein FF38_03572, partial [Lucilia cuprina]
MNRSQIVTIVPPNLTETTWLDEKTAGQPYMQAWAIYLANSMGNATPESVDMLKKSIGPFLDAGIYTQVMKRIDDQIDQIKRDRISLSFTPTRVYHDPKAPGTYFVEGSQGLEGIAGAAIAGVGGALDRLADFYMNMAGDLFPVIEIDPGRSVDFIVQKEYGCKGMPNAVTCMNIRDIHQLTDGDDYQERIDAVSEQQLSGKPVDLKRGNIASNAGAGGVATGGRYVPVPAATANPQPIRTQAQV